MYAGFPCIFLSLYIYLQPSFHYKQGHLKITKIQSNICFEGLALALYRQSFYREILKLKKDFVKSRGLPNVFPQSKKPALVNEHPVIVSNHLAA